MDDCVFCKIINKDIPAKIVYEDEEVLVMMDINPATKGHMLVIPKSHHTDVTDTPNETLQKIITVAKQCGILAKEKLRADGFNIVNASGKEAQQSVFHLHFHIVPRYKNDGLDLWFHARESNKDEIEDAYKKIT